MECVCDWVHTTPALSPFWEVWLTWQSKRSRKRREISLLVKRYNYELSDTHFWPNTREKDWQLSDCLFSWSLVSVSVQHPLYRMKREQIDERTFIPLEELTKWLSHSLAVIEKRNERCNHLIISWSDYDDDDEDDERESYDDHRFNWIELTGSFLSASSF